MLNQLGKFIPNLAILNEPLRQLLRKDTIWKWDLQQQEAFTAMKNALLSPKTLAHYDSSHPTVIAADACNTGVGAVMMQIQRDGRHRPVCFASRSLTETEQRYAVIEKEALAATWACEKFADYITGIPFTLETDHKPLVPLLSTKDLSKIPPHILRFRLRMMRYSPEVTHVPGKVQVTADALSRAPVSKPDPADIHLVQVTEEFAEGALSLLPASARKLRVIAMAQDKDETCAEVKKFGRAGWPAYIHNNPLLKPYFENRAHLAITNNLLILDDRIVIPQALRLEMLNLIHTGHLGITKCRARARAAIWWPGLSSNIETITTQCNTCSKLRPTPREPLVPSSFPSRPWECIGMDLFEFKDQTYLLVVDYYSRWPEMRKLTSLSSEAVIRHLKDMFSTHGIPDLAVSDNGPQFDSQAFRAFVNAYQFTHVTSSPTYAQANGEAERGVRTMKGLLEKNDDPYLALLTYRTTPLQNGLTPSELLMGRKLQTQLPALPNSFKVCQQDHELVTEKEKGYRMKQADNYNDRHRARILPTLAPDDHVWVSDQK